MGRPKGVAATRPRFQLEVSGLEKLPATIAGWELELIAGVLRVVAKKSTIKPTRLTESPMPRSKPSVATRSEWVSYVRVSTSGQADRDLSLPAQRHAIAEYAARHGAVIAREYVEAGSSGADPHRRELRRMLGDGWRRGATSRSSSCTIRRASCATRPKRAP